MSSTKRSADAVSGSSGQEPAKRAKTATLSTWLSAPIPSLIVASAEINDKDSTFISHAASVKSQREATRFRQHVLELHAEDAASHEMLGWRIMSVCSVLCHS